MPVRTKEIDIEEMLDRKARRKKAFSTVLPFLGLLLTIIVMAIATKGVLLSAENMVNIINQCFHTAIVGVGAAFVYAHGGMDFSVGSSCGVAQLVCIALVTKAGAPLWVGVLASIAVGVVNALIVGVGAYKLHLQPFIVSLCVRSACAGVLIAGTNAMGRNVRVPLEVFGVFNDNVFKAIVLVVLVAVCWYLFEKTSLGKSEKAIGGNAVTSTQSGILTGRNIFYAYLILGICVGIAASFQMARGGMVTTTSGSGLEFNIMIALALGGFPMAGGSAAKIRAMIIGVLTITILTNGLTIAGVDSLYVNLVKGCLFVAIVAVSYDRSNLKQVVFM